MTTLSIAHVLSSFSVGGQERVALDLARRQRADGHRVVALSLANDPHGPLVASFRAADVPCETLQKWGPSFDPTLSLRCARVLSAHDVDLVHTHNPQALVYGSPAAALRGAACVHTKHGINPDPQRRMWLRRAASAMVHAYVAVTPSLARVALERNECEAATLRVIPNGIDTDRFRSDREARLRVREELGIPQDAWVLGTVGRLAPEKRQDTLIDAAAPLLDPRRHLVIVGDGPELGQLRERAKGTLRPGLVHLTGARDDVEALLSAFDVFVLTSQSEGLPLVLLEAMSVGLPVVSTNVGGVPDVVQHGQTGYLVPPGDPLALTKQLIWLSTRPREALEVSANGQSYARSRHSLEHMANAYENLYQRVIGRHLPELARAAG